MDFNVSMKEGAYRERPTPTRTNIDRAGDMQNTLLKALGQITDAAVGGLMEKAKSDAKKEAEDNKNKAREFINEGAIDAGLRASNPAYNAERSAEEETAASQEILQRDADAYDSIIDPVTGAISEQNYLAYADAIAASTKELGKVKAKAEQQGKHFDYKSAVAQIYIKATKQYGAAAAAAAFEELTGKQPLKFLTEDVIEAEQAAKAKAAEAQAKTVEDVAKALGMMKFIGESDAEFTGRVMQGQQTVMMIEEDSEKLEFFNSQPVAVSDSLRKPVEGRFAANMINKSYMDLSQTLSGFDPVTATPEQRQSYLQRIQDYRAMSAQLLNSLVISDPTTRSYAMSQIESNVKVFEDLVLGKTNTSVTDGMNKLRASQALFELGQDVPNYHKLAQVNELGALISSNSLFGAGFTQLVQDTSGKAIVRALVSGDLSAIAANPPSPGEWQKINLRVLEMAKQHPQFANIIAHNSVKMLSAAMDPITGRWNDPNATVGLLSLYGSQEYFQYIQPTLRKELGDTRFVNFANDVISKTRDEMFVQLSKAPELLNSLNKSKDGDRTVIVEMTKAGNLLLGYEEDGKIKYFADQDRGTVNAARNALGAGVRSMAHFNNSQEYGEWMSRVLDSDFQYPNKVRYVSRQAYEARLKEMQSKKD